MWKNGKPILVRFALQSYVVHIFHSLDFGAIVAPLCVCVHFSLLLISIPSNSYLESQYVACHNAPRELQCYMSSVTASRACGVVVVSIQTFITKNTHASENLTWHKLYILMFLIIKSNGIQSALKYSRVLHKNAPGAGASELSSCPTETYSSVPNKRTGRNKRTILGGHTAHLISTLSGENEFSTLRAENEFSILVV